jgi:general nucleoside transport system ATP-binding protein
VKQFDVRTPGIEIPVANLSGGNQQKVIVAREFSRPIRLLIASQPTRGLDVGSIEYIHGQILQKRAEGCAVLLVSPELDEILTLSDRIAVMYEGRIIAVLPAAEATREKLGLLMAGIRESEAAPVASQAAG